MVEQILDASADRVQRHPRRRDAFFEQRLAGPLEGVVGSGAGRLPRAWTPCRSSPCTACCPGRASGRRATRRCRRTTIRSSRWRHRRPAPAPRRGGDARRRRPTHVRRVALLPKRIRGQPRIGAGRRRSSCASCTSPPGPTPTLTIDAPALTRSRVPSADTTLPATSGTFRSSDAIDLIASSALA